MTERTDARRTTAGEERRGPGGRDVSRPLEREAEFIAVHTALDRLSSRSSPGSVGPAARRGGLLAFTGPSGAGKTTVLDEVRRLAAERDCIVLSAKGREQEQGVAFHVVRQLLQPLLASYSDDERREVLGAWHAIIGPCVGLCPGEQEATPDPQGVRDGLDWVITNVAVRRGPLVLVVDDAHWADPESLAWLSSFTGRLEDLPGLMVVAYRSEEPPGGAEGFGDVMAHERARPLALEPLTPAAVATLLRAMLGEDADGDFCHEAWIVTGGNPYETVELAAKIRGRGVAPGQENAWLLRDLAASTKDGGVLDRLEQLGNSAVRLAWSVAVLGSEARLGLATRLAALGTAEACEAADRLRAERILKQGEPLEFVHPLIGTAVYRAIPAAMRVALHGKAAWDLLESGQGPGVAARHLLETHPDGDASVAEQLHAAAREYLRRGAPDAAQRCLTRALREPPPAELRATILYELGSLALMHDAATAVNHLRAALAEPDLSPALRQDIVIRLARALAYCDRMTEATGVMQEEARTATDARTRLRMLAEHFMLAAFTSEDHNAPVLSRRLTQLTQRLTGRDETERYLFGLRGWDAVVRGEPASTAVDFAERALAGGMSWTDEHWGFEVPALVALTFLYCDRPERAEELFTHGIAEFEREGWHGTPLALAYTFLGYIRFRCGRLTDAEDFVRTGLRLADRVGPKAPVHWYAVGSLIEILLARGRDAEAEQLAADHGFSEPFPSAMTFPDAQTVHGELLLARGMVKEASEELAAVGRRLDGHGMHNPGLYSWLLHLALAAADSDIHRARDLAEEAVRRAERFGTGSAVGQALRVLARLSEETRAISVLERAVGQFERSPSSCELACALVELGTVLRRSGQVRQAAEHLYRGVDLAVRCGAEGMVARARDELTASGLRPRRLGVVRQ